MKILAVLIALCISGCANAPRVDYAEMPSSLYSSDPDDAALQEAQVMFGPSGQRPAALRDRARGFAALEYISGALQVHPRWVALSDAAKLKLTQIRVAAREAIGVAPAAKSQTVVNVLLAVSRTKDDTALMANLNDPIFTLGARATRERLENLLPMGEIGSNLQVVSQEVTALNNKASTGGY